MPHRKLRIVRLTPIALALCEHCNGQFHSRKCVQEEAKAELVAQFDVHQCQRNSEKIMQALETEMRRLEEVEASINSPV